MEHFGIAAWIACRDRDSGLSDHAHQQVLVLQLHNRLSASTAVYQVPGICGSPRRPCLRKPPLETQPSPGRGLFTCSRGGCNKRAVSGTARGCKLDPCYQQNTFVSCWRPQSVVLSSVSVRTAQFPQDGSSSRIYVPWYEQRKAIRSTVSQPVRSHRGTHKRRNPDHGPTRK